MIHKPYGVRPAPPFNPPETSGILFGMPKELGFYERNYLASRRRRITFDLQSGAKADVRDSLDIYETDGWRLAEYQSKRRDLFAPVGFLAIRATIYQYSSVREFRSAVALAGEWASHYGLYNHSRALQALYDNRMLYPSAAEDDA